MCCEKPKGENEKVKANAKSRESNWSAHAGNSGELNDRCLFALSVAFDIFHCQNGKQISFFDVGMSFVTTKDCT